MEISFGVNIYDKDGDIVERGVYIFFGENAVIKFEDYDEFESFVKRFSSEHTLNEIKENWDRG